MSNLDQPYIDLAIAVSKGAALDYERGLKYMKKHKLSENDFVRSRYYESYICAKRFFESNSPFLLGLDGDTIKMKIEEMVEKGDSLNSGKYRILKG